MKTAHRGAYRGVVACAAPNVAGHLAGGAR